MLLRRKMFLKNYTTVDPKQVGQQQEGSQDRRQRETEGKQGGKGRTRAVTDLGDK